MIEQTDPIVNELKLFSYLGWVNAVLQLLIRSTLENETEFLVK